MSTTTSAWSMPLCMHNRAPERLPDAFYVCITEHQSVCLLPSMYASQSTRASAWCLLWMHHRAPEHLPVAFYVCITEHQSVCLMPSMYASQSTRASAWCLLCTCASCITSYLGLGFVVTPMIPVHVGQNPLQWLWKHGPFSWLHASSGLPSLSACYWLFICRSDFLITVTVKLPLSGLLTNRHLLLPGTIYFWPPKLNSCFCSAALLVTGEWLVHSAWNHGVCTQGLHPVASLTL